MDVAPANLTGHYKRSKYEGAVAALKMADEGLPVVVVNPTDPIRPWDVKPTPTGRIVLDFLKRTLPVYINTGMNVVDVEDVALGHVLALQKGTPGPRYIMGNRNVELNEILTTLEAITGRQSPRFKVPILPVMALGVLDQLIEGKLVRRRPVIPLEGSRVACKPMYVISSMAVRELGLPQSPIRRRLRESGTVVPGLRTSIGKTTKEFITK